MLHWSSEIIIAANPVAEDRLVIKNESATESSAKNPDDSRIFSFKSKPKSSGSSSNRYITNVIAVGGFTNHLKFIKICNSMRAILLSLNLPLPSHESVDSLMMADSLVLMAMWRVAIEAISTKSLLGMHSLVAKNLSNSDMLNATTSRDKSK